MFKYRPTGEADGTNEEFWADNWFSNALAYLSKRVIPAWCQSEEHWTVKFMDLFWTDCACCLFYRGIVVGYLTGAFVASACTALLAVLFF